jgi:hypothetical protein
VDTTAVRDKIVKVGGKLAQASEGIVPHDARMQLLERGKKGVDHTKETLGIKKPVSNYRRMINAAKGHPIRVTAILVALAGARTFKPKAQD